MVCFRYVIVNTLHKGDNKDDDDDDIIIITVGKNKFHKILTIKHHDKSHRNT